MTQIVDKRASAAMGPSSASAVPTLTAHKGAQTYMKGHISIGKGTVQFLQVLVVGALTGLANHYGKLQLSATDQTVTVGSVIGLLETLAAQFPALKPWLGSI